LAIRESTPHVRELYGPVVFVEIGDERLRASFAVFLDAKFGGSVFDRDTGLELDFRVPTMPPSVQLRLTERLLWAWHANHAPPMETEVTLTASPSEDLDSDEPQHEAMKLRLGS
jgi:hypothetical protein